MSLEDGSALEVMELATGQVRRYVSSTGRLYGLDWSPDGTRIVYADTPKDKPDGNAELYLLDVADGRVRQLTDNDDYDHMPVRLPGGNEPMFSSYASGREEIYVLGLGAAMSGGLLRGWQTRVDPGGAKDYPPR